MLLFVKIKYACYAWTEYKFTWLSVCPSHFLSTRLQVKPVAAVADVKKDIIIVGDFNFPEIDWDLHYSTNKSFGSRAYSFFEYSS